MKDTPHTPGPWLRHGLTIYTLRPRTQNPNATSFETVWSALVQPDGQHRTAPEELEANACLIEAAPDLLEALEELTALGSSELPQRRDAALLKARAAIAKAKGGKA